MAPDDADGDAADPTHVANADYATTADDSDTVDGYHAEDIIQEAVNRVKAGLEDAADAGTTVGGDD